MNRRDDVHILIRNTRRAAGLKQSDIAAACTPAITNSAVSHWEHTDPDIRTKPNDNQLKLVAKLTNKPLSYFFVEETGETSDQYRVKESSSSFQPADNQVFELLDIFKGHDFYDRQKILNFAKQLPKTKEIK